MNNLGNALLLAGRVLWVGIFEANAIALQSAELQLAEGARLEWLPLEAIAHPGCQAENSVCAMSRPCAQPARPGRWPHPSCFSTANPPSDR